MLIVSIFDGCEIVFKDCRNFISFLKYSVWVEEVFIRMYINTGKFYKDLSGIIIRVNCFKFLKIVFKMLFVNIF